MPIFRYFMFVGGALLALLFVAGYALPEAPAGQTVVAANPEVPQIRIRSDRKLPERVVLDTSQPTIVPPARQTAANVAPQHAAHPGASTQVGESFAQLASNAAKTESKTEARTEAKTEAKTGARTEVAAVKKVEARQTPHRKVARSRSAAPYYYGRPMLMAQQPHFGLFNMTW